ncbi:MAG: hypothetical protein LBB88_01455 [Planctomycetaceae bacterium]|nr:hypothetical protein [Planctomycetaceae bacterium]
MKSGIITRDLFSSIDQIQTSIFSRIIFGGLRGRWGHWGRFYLKSDLKRLKGTSKNLM